MSKMLVIVIEKICLLVLCCGFVAVCVILALTVYRHSGYQEAKSTENVTLGLYGKPRVDSIKILNKNIYLAPGTDAYLEIDIEPADVQREDLDYTSSDPTVVRTEKHHIIAHEGWQEDANHNITITAQGGFMAEDKAYVTIINVEDGSSQQESRGEGDYTDASAGLPN